MTAVASQPTTRRRPVTVNCRMIFLFEVISIIITMTGTATIPLITALQNSALIGSIGEKLTPKPVPTYQGGDNIGADFIHCVKTREKPFRDIELAVNSSAVSHLGNIAYALRRSLKFLA